MPVTLLATGLALANSVRAQSEARPPVTLADPPPPFFADLQPYVLPLALFAALVFGAFLRQRRLLARLARQTEELRYSREQLALVLEGSSDGFWDWDIPSGRIERSERWASMLGYTLAEIAPKLEGATMLVHPDDLSLYHAWHARVNRDLDDRYDFEYRLKAKSGEWRWILDRGKVVTRARDGTPLRMAGTHTDITHLKQAEQALAHNEAQFRFIYEHTPVGLSWRVRNQDSRGRLVNRAHEGITGVPASRSHEASAYTAASHPDDRTRQWELQTRLNRGEIDRFSMEKRYVHPDGRMVWAILTMHMFRDAITGEARELTSLVDITDRKRAEQERENLHRKMLETQKLESLGVLAGGIAHDFNNLLTIVLAHTTLLRRDTTDAATDDRLLQIETASRRAADLCRQMLAYAGRGSFVIEPVDVCALVRDTAALLEASLSKKARLVLALEPGLHHVKADASQLRQIVMNLVINASEALLDAPGQIRLVARVGRPEPAPGRLSHVFDLPLGDCVCLEVTDTGHGMSPETLEKIFDPFFTTKFTGRGLGLAAVAGIVRAHRGALTVESRPGVGTTFCLYLPALEGYAPPPVSTAPPSSTPKPACAPATGTLLIADDEPVVLSTLDLILRRRGYGTALAANGTEALALFRANPRGFAAVLLDLTMPGLDGAEVLREIRVIHPEARVLIMSGFSEDDVLRRLRGLGPITVLPKPFTAETLILRLAEVVAG